MDREYLFDAALVALGPPFPVSAHGLRKTVSAGAFNAHVQEYNEFAKANWGINLLYQVSYAAWSDWFHHEKD